LEELPAFLDILFHVRISDGDTTGMLPVGNKGKRFRKNSEINPYVLFRNTSVSTFFYVHQYNPVGGKIWENSRTDPQGKMAGADQERGMGTGFQSSLISRRRIGILASRPSAILK